MDGWTLLVFKEQTQSVQTLSEVWAHYGHVLGLFCVFGHVIYSLLEVSKIYQNFGHVFRHFQLSWTFFGHILGTLQGLDKFWTHFGHFWGIIVQNASIPPLCSSTEAVSLLSTNL